MGIYMYMGIYIYIYVVCIYIYIYMYMRMCRCVCGIYIYIYICVCRFIYIYMLLLLKFRSILNLLFQLAYWNVSSDFGRRAECEVVILTTLLQLLDGTIFCSLKLQSVFVQPTGIHLEVSSRYLPGFFCL